jgi:hypothetical protein
MDRLRSRVGIPLGQPCTNVVKDVRGGQIIVAKTRKINKQDGVGLTLSSGGFNPEPSLAQTMTVKELVGSFC